MNKQTGLVLAGVAAFVVFIAGFTVFVLKSWTSDNEAPACALTKPQGIEPTSSTASPEIAIVEQGWSVVPDEYPRVSIGVVLQNRSDRTAYRTRVVFDAFDATGEPVVEGAQRRYRIIEIPILPPGAKAAVGDTLTASERAQVTQVSATPVVSEWLPAGGPVQGLATVTAQVASARRGGDGSAAFAYTTRSENCADLVSRGIGFTWRNSAGKIVGGNVDGASQPTACQAGGATVALNNESAALTVPVEADPGRTEVTAFCDLLPPSQMSRPDQPIN